jgi:hypothetical protein
MITAVNFRPKFYSPGYNPIIWSVTSDKTTQIDFAYVFDLYIDSVYINRFIQRPNPSGVGMIDVSSMVSPFLDIGNFANEVGTPTSLPFKMGTNAVCNVKLFGGEQYRAAANADVITYDGVQNVTPGNPAYPLGAQTFYDVNDPEDNNDVLPVIVLPTSLDWRRQQEHMQAQMPTVDAPLTVSLGDYYGIFGYMAPYVLKNDSVLPSSTCGGPGLFLSEYPRSITGGAWQTTSTSPSHNISAEALAYDRYAVTFLNRNPVYEEYGTGGLLQNASPKVAWFTFYSATGANIGNGFVQNAETDGGGPRVTCNGSIATGGTGSFSNVNNQEFLSLRVGPKDLEDIGQWTLLGQVPSYYTVQLFNNITFNAGCTAASAPSVPVSELLTIDIVEDCTSSLYPRARVCWLNSLGGRDYWNFTMKAEETIDATADSFYQTEVNWSATTPVALTNDTTLNWLRGGVRQYNRAIKTKWQITSDFLTQEEVEFIKGIVKSPQTWVYIGQEDFPFTCKISESSYTVKTIKQVKLYTANFTLEFSTEQSMQNI